MQHNVKSKLKQSLQSTSQIKLIWAKNYQIKVINKDLNVMHRRLQTNFKSLHELIH